MAPAGFIAFCADLERDHSRTCITAQIPCVELKSPDHVVIEL